MAGDISMKNNPFVGKIHCLSEKNTLFEPKNKVKIPFVRRPKVATPISFKKLCQISGKFEEICPLKNSTFRFISSLELQSLKKR
ncbi:MAG: hypothetical protein AB1414_12985 [bacterium]